MSTLIAIVARNSIALTKIAVRSALAQVPYGEAVLVIDNASSDGTRQWLSTKPVATVTFTERMSLSACWNSVFECVARGNFDRVLMCNNDIRMLSTTLFHLEKFSLPFVSGVGVDKEEQLTLPNKLEVTDHPDFSCFLMTLEAYRAVGEFDEKFYPAYAEDCDYHVRMHRAGIKAHGSNMPFYHYGSGTLKSATGAEANLIRKGADSSREYFKSKYGCYPGTPEYNALFAQESLNCGSQLNPLV